RAKTSCARSTPPERRSPSLRRKATLFERRHTSVNSATPFRVRLSAFPERGRRRHGAAWRPRHLAKAAEVDLRHRPAKPAGGGGRELVIALETAAQPAAPGRDAAAGVQFEGGFAAVERRRDVVPRHLQQ